MLAARILVADDEAEIRNLLARYLEQEGYVVDAVPGGKAALACFAATAYDLVILDLMMSDVDGWEVCRAIRRESSVPVLILSARDAEADKVSGLMLGADDYVTKPFAMGELVARVRAHLRRSRMVASGDPTAGAVPAARADERPRRESREPAAISSRGLTVDFARHSVTKRGESLALTPKEFELLAFLMGSPGQVFTKRQIFAAVWGDVVLDAENTVMVHIRRLRTRVEDDPSEPTLIRTVHGIGYSFAEE
jgi:DNA-binding response OmpR family regulator